MKLTITLDCPRGELLDPVLVEKWIKSLKGVGIAVLLKSMEANSVSYTFSNEEIVDD